MKKYKVAVVGGHGLVGESLIKILMKEKFPYSSLTIYGQFDDLLKIGDLELDVIRLSDEAIEPFDFVFMCVSNELSAKYTPKFVALGAKVIDNSSYYRLKDNIPLVIPELNKEDLLIDSQIFANPNCTTIMILKALYPLVERFKLEKCYISTYQATSGAGKEALREYELEKNNPNYIPKILPTKNLSKSTIFDNLLPIVDDILDNGYTYEEEKVLLESKKILHISKLEILTTAVRVPTSIGHGATVYAVFEEKIDLEEVKKLLMEASYLKVFFDRAYPTLLDVRNTYDVAVGRIRKDLNCEYTLAFFVTSDNLIVGASYNAYKIALQLAEYYKNEI